MTYFQHNSRNNTQNSSYQNIYDNIKNARSVTALTRVIENCLPELYKLDENQQERLESHGLRCFNQIQIETLKLEGMIKSKRH